MEIIELQSVGSTNTWTRDHASELVAPTLVYAVEQTSGRGQKGNTWESEPGKNLTASVFFADTGIEPASQFYISEAIALAVTDLLADIGIESHVKWPNDIYVCDKKIAGILIEHSIMARCILNTVAGIGLNLNQREFLSDAPNPVSVSLLTDREFPVGRMASELAAHIVRRLKDASENQDSLHAEYMEKLWRGDGGTYPFFDKIAGERIEGSIACVAPDGKLTLRLSDGSRREYMFKETEFLLL